MTKQHSKPVKTQLRLYNMKIKALGHGLESNIALGSPRAILISRPPRHASISILHTQQCFN